MLVKLKRKCEFNGKVYPAGAHNLPDSLSQHWFFKALMKDGDAVVEGAAPAIKEDAKPEAPVVTVLGSEPETAETEDGEESDSPSLDDEELDEVTSEEEDVEEDVAAPKKKKTKKKKKK